MTNMEGVIIDSNESYRQMLGYSENELRNLTYKVLTPEKWHSLEDKIVSDQILPNGYSAVYEKEYIRKDNIVIPVELRTFLVCDEQGIIEGMGAIVRDITERKRAESLLMESEEKYRSIVEASLTAMLFYELNGEGQLIFQGSNPAADRILGISHESLVGLTLGEAFPNLRNTTIPELYTRIALGESGPQSFEIQYEDERFSGFFFVHVFKTGVKTITVDFIDITERRKSEQAIRRSEVEYRDTLNSLPDWIYVVDSSFKIVMINASLDDAMTSGASIVNRIGGRIVVGPPFVSLEDISVVMTVFNSGSIVVRRQKITHLGREIFTEITVVPIRKGREVVKVIVIIRDRSKEMEIEKLKQRSADQKEVLLREIHHRVKNNLSIVISLLSFQLNDNENPIIKRSLIDIQTRIRAMALIHEHLYRSENLDRIPLATYVSSLVQMVISTFSGNNVRIEYHLMPIESSIETALPVGLIINELLTNAFKYAFPDKNPGTILVGLSEAEEDFCLITVSDNGVGLPANFIPESSSSLGMYIVRLLAEQLDGTLQIDRTNGTTFNIRFRNMIRKSQITIY
jgi:PAS domain S-box-containing protein